jgi:NADH:ubiquinone oxidoreductase subunit 2 (subunit N)
VYYYLRVIVTMFDTSLLSRPALRRGPQIAQWAIGAPLGVVLILLLLLGLYPQTLIQLVGFMLGVSAGDHTAQASF